MPLPATHVLANLFIFYPFRKSLGKYWAIFAIFSGLLADFDFVFNYCGDLFGISVGCFGHGGFFHSVGFVILLLGIALVVYARNKEYGKYAFMLVMGVTIHILLDLVLGGGAYSLALFFPFSDAVFRIHLLAPWQENAYGILDALMILILMIWYWFKLRCNNE